MGEFYGTCGALDRIPPAVGTGDCRVTTIYVDVNCKAKKYLFELLSSEI